MKLQFLSGIYFTQIRKEEDKLTFTYLNIIVGKYLQTVYFCFIEILPSSPDRGGGVSIKISMKSVFPQFSNHPEKLFHFLVRETTFGL